MDYEKKYKEALERARQIKNGEDGWGYCDLIEITPALEEVFPELADSDDEKIRKFLIDLVSTMNWRAGWPADKVKEEKEKCLAYLEKQKELDKMIVVSPEVWDCAISDAFENGKKEGEKQKDASKAIEAVERIDKYIDEHLANAHDMKGSNPDKKYYRGWDDALGKMAGILQDVYSNEK